MNPPLLKLSDYMTNAPHVVGPDTPVANALHFFDKAHVRHLPVVRDGKLVGLAVQTDLRSLEGVDGLDLYEIPIHDVMRHHPYCVGPQALLDDVVHEMASRKCDSAVVVSNGRVVGILTTIDVMNAFSELLLKLARGDAATTGRDVQ